METYFKNDYVDVNYDKDIHVLIVHYGWFSSTSAESKKGMSMTTSAMKHFNTGQAIWDTLLMDAISLLDRHWTTTEHYDKARDIGYSQAANVTEHLYLMVVEDMISQVNNPIPIAYFDNTKAAID
ncbi:hypothetical protein [Chryseolinea soli]|uniref:Uncharacterized protein n=1 Tax=Chryseolinea soli TaxID=2321403 RepID=A0A385SQ19_9BACT|nr:hypothetical protein [Chryseolinea soli]AYB32055.1 hypothetical protein D4L85_16415 [Chryseolinea soli]